MTRAALPTLSVVVPVYNEAGNITPLFTEISEVMTEIGRPCEGICHSRRETG